MESRVPAWKDWLSWRVIRGYAPYLSKAFTEELFDFYGRTLTGAQEQRERWKRGVSLVEGTMGEAVGKIYVEGHFPPTAKARMDVLVENLVKAYHDSISTLEWMGPQTRERALEKLAAFTPKIGYPVKWRDYSTLEIEPDRPDRQRPRGQCLRVQSRVGEDRCADRPRRVVHVPPDG